MIRKYKLNVDLSLDVAETCGYDIIRRRDCYSNTFKVSRHYGTKFLDNKWKVAYGYVTGSVDGILVRHAFVLDGNEDVIDVTMTKTSFFERECENFEYVTFKVFEQFSEYVSAIVLNDGDLSFFGKYPDDEMKINLWALENDLVCVGQTAFTY